MSYSALNPPIGGKSTQNYNIKHEWAKKAD